MRYPRAQGGHPSPTNPTGLNIKRLVSGRSPVAQTLSPAHILAHSSQAPGSNLDPSGSGKVPSSGGAPGSSSEQNYYASMGMESDAYSETMDKAVLKNIEDSLLGDLNELFSIDTEDELLETGEGTNKDESRLSPLELDPTSCK